MDQSPAVEPINLIINWDAELKKCRWSIRHETRTGRITVPRECVFGKPETEPKPFLFGRNSSTCVNGLVVLTQRTWQG